MSFIKSSLLSFSGSIAQVLIAFLTGIILARALNPEGLGQYSLVISLVTIFGVIASMGLGQSAIFYVNNKKLDPHVIIPAVVQLSLLLGLATFFISILILQLESYFGSMTVLAISFVATYGFGSVVYENLHRIPLVFQNIGQFVLARFIPGFVTLCLLASSYIFSDLSTHDAWLFVALGQIAGVFLLFVLIKDFLVTKGRTEPVNVKQLFDYGFKIHLTYLWLLLSNEIGLFLVRYLTNDFSEVSYFRLAIRLAGILLIFPQSIGPLFFARWSIAREDVRLQEVELVSRIFYLLTIVGILLIFLVADKLVVLLYGSAYIHTVSVLKIVLIGVGVRLVMMPVFNLFASSGYPLYCTYVYLVDLIVSISLMFVLIPSFGSVGAGAAFSIGYLASVVVCYYLARAHLGLNLKDCFLLRASDLKLLRDRFSGKLS